MTISLMPWNGTVAVFGAYGHTGRFIVSELRNRGWKTILSGRDPAKLEALNETLPGAECRVAATDDPVSLDRALSGASAVINCAGPFLDTADPVINGAFRAGIPYLDLAAEQTAVLSVFERFADAARDAALVVIPAMAFYGGLGDLLATAAMGTWDYADEISIATALDSWKPTRGTRRTGQRNAGPRFYFSNNKLERSDPPPPRVWNFPLPFGKQNVESLSLSETIIISRHLQTPEIRAYINRQPLIDLRDPHTPPPTPADDDGRSSQVFLMDVIVKKGNARHRAIARGRDIYAVSAPIVVEAMERVVKGHAKATGVRSPGEIFDARDFLSALSPAHLSLEIQDHE